MPYSASMSGYGPSSLPCSAPARANPPSPKTYLIDPESFRNSVSCNLFPFSLFRIPRGWGTPVSIPPILNNLRADPMSSHNPSDRCTYRDAAGRRCRSPRKATHPDLCAHHARFGPEGTLEDPQALVAEVLDPSPGFRTAQAVNHSDAAFDSYSVRRFWWAPWNTSKLLAQSRAAALLP